MHGTALIDVAGATIQVGTRCHTCSVRTQRSRNAKPVVIAKCNIDIIHTGVPRTDGAHLLPATKTGVVKGEEVNRTGIGVGVSCTIVQPRTCGQVQTVTAECHTKTELIVVTELDIHIFTTNIPMPDCSCQRSTAKVAIGKCDQVNGARGSGAVTIAIVTGCTYC